ncbi:MAG: 5-bromo-4-chloroindolyl phosphate hydrolysis family protein [Planktomarina sp.]
MSQRFGGKYSPDGSTQSAAPQANTYKDAKPAKAGARSNFLFVPPLWLIIDLLFYPINMALGVVGFVLLIAAAYMTREGLLAKQAYDARNVARRPAFPRIISGSILIGLGVCVTLVAKSEALNTSIFTGLVMGGLHMLSFGFDPLKDKGFDGVNAFQQNRVAAVVEEAEKSLMIMEATAADLGDRHMERRIDQFTTSARDLFRRVEEDPQDLTAARKFMSVYLTGAKDATQKFAAIYSKKKDPAARDEFLTFLDDLEDNFTAKTETLLANNKTDLEIEMKVLRDRLSREGLTTK